MLAIGPHLVRWDTDAGFRAWTVEADARTARLGDALYLVEPTRGVSVIGPRAHRGRRAAGAARHARLGRGGRRTTAAPHRLGNAALEKGIGILVEDASGNTIGGTTPGAGNTIGFNGSGIDGRRGSVNPILGNRILDNDGLGINLDQDGVTPNDGCGDADTGPNGLQNFPVLASALVSGGTTTIDYDLDTAAGTYRVEFFSVDTPDPSSHGEGRTFLGAEEVTVSGTCAEAFQAVLPTALAAGAFVRATATPVDAAQPSGFGGTSEFSAALPADTTPPTVEITTTSPDPTNVEPIPVTFTFSEEVTGFEASDVTETGGTLQGFDDSGAPVNTAEVAPDGSCEVTVAVAAGVATDPAGNPNEASNTLSVTFDDEAPTLTVTAEPLVLWPPNHSYHTVSLTDLGLEATDACGTPGAPVITAVTSDEPENGRGDGNTTDDIVVVDCQTVQVRAERQGGGDGRVYTLALAVADAAGNIGTATYQVQVPKSRNRTALDSGATYSVDGCEATAPAPLAAASTTEAAAGTTAAGTSGTPRAASTTSLPETVALHAAYPNPSTHTTTIPVDLPAATHLTVTAYDLLGRTVATLADGPTEAGRHALTFDAAMLSAGAYVGRMTTAEGEAQTQRLTLVR